MVICRAAGYCGNLRRYLVRAWCAGRLDARATAVHSMHALHLAHAGRRLRGASTVNHAIDASTVRYMTVLDQQAGCDGRMGRTSTAWPDSGAPHMPACIQLGCSMVGLAPVISDACAHHLDTDSASGVLPIHRSQLQQARAPAPKQRQQQSGSRIRSRCRVVCACRSSALARTKWKVPRRSGADTQLMLLL